MRRSQGPRHYGRIAMAPQAMMRAIFALSRACRRNPSSEIRRLRFGSMSDPNFLVRPLVRKRTAMSDRKALPGKFVGSELVTDD